MAVVKILVLKKVNVLEMGRRRTLGCYRPNSANTANSAVWLGEVEAQGRVRYSVPFRVEALRLLSILKSYPYSCPSLVRYPAIKRSEGKVLPTSLSKWGQSIS